MQVNLGGAEILILFLLIVETGSSPKILEAFVSSADVDGDAIWLVVFSEKKKYTSEFHIIQTNDCFFQYFAAVVVSVAHTDFG